MFDKHDAYIRRERGRKCGTYGNFEGMNIGTKFKPKMINIGSIYSNEEKIKAKRLLSEYQDVFSWGYEDLKIYRNGKCKQNAQFQVLNERPNIDKK